MEETGNKCFRSDCCLGLQKIGVVVISYSITVLCVVVESGRVGQVLAGSKFLGKEDIKVSLLLVVVVFPVWADLYGRINAVWSSELDQ